MPKICRIITDEKIGNINPAFALAEAISEHIPLEIQHIKLRDTLLRRLIPIKLVSYLPITKYILKLYDIEDHDNIALTIGNGSTSIFPCALLSIKNKKTNKNNGLFIQLQNPRINLNYFDYVIPPIHDDVIGENIIPTVGSLSRVKYFINHTEIPIPPEFSDLPKPMVGVFIGGKNRRFSFSQDEATKLAHYLLDYVVYHKASLIVTCSRRTGNKNERLLRSLLKHPNIFFPQSDYPNPYYAMMKYCDRTIVTGDSINMISDAATAGLRIIIYELEGHKGKFQKFYDSLRSKNLLSIQSRKTRGNHESIDNFDEAQRVAKIIVNALSKQ